MILRAKRIDLTTGNVLVAVLSKEDAHRLDVRGSDRIRIIYYGTQITAVVDVSEKGVKAGEIGLLNETYDKLGMKDGQNVNVILEDKPQSLGAIKKKLFGGKLTKDEIYTLVKEIVRDELNDVEIAYFVSGCSAHGLNLEETTNLTKAMVDFGTRLDLGNGKIVDKHSTGGVPNNRTTMLIVPIVAAAGLTMPKTSSRAITSSAGTADTMEVLAPVMHPINKIKDIIKKTNACIIWGGAMELAAADDRMIRVRYPLSLDPEGLILSSIMAKKSAVGSKYVLIDIPLGKDTKVDTKEKALELKKQFIHLGSKLGIKVNVMISDGSQPIGKGIGPALEARDILWILKGDKRGPEDLKKKAIYMAGLILKMAKAGDEKNAAKLLESGAAYEKMREIIREQGGDPDVNPDNIKIGRHSYIVRAIKSGKITDINNLSVAKLARIAGAPIDSGAGLYMNVKKGDSVRKGDKLFTVYSESAKKLDFTLEIFHKFPVVTIK